MSPSHNNYLQNAHYEAMRKLGYTDEEIEEDYIQVLKDLDLFNDWLREKAQVQVIRNEGSPKSVPW